MENNFNKINIERKISQVEFPVLNKEDLKEIDSLFSYISHRFNEEKEISGFEPYIGLDTKIGTKDIYCNSLMTLFQFEYALAMTRHPLIKKIAQYNSEEQLNAKELVENKIMNGMKILDLGCGPEPVFARACRAMGADVWTVDVISADNFISNIKLFNQEQKSLEAQKHIKLNLNDKQAVDIIRSKSSGDFNLITEANLIPHPRYSTDNVDGKCEDTAMSLLKKGGIYNDVSSILNPLKLKE